MNSEIETIGFGAMGVGTVGITELPDIISEQMSLIEELGKKYEVAKQKAKKAEKSADNASGKSAGLFHKREAIESLQSAQVDVADAVVSLTEAQKLSFDYQEQLGKITQYLFGLGVTNIAANRTVVRQLEMKLSGATKEEMDEFARQEIVSVINQLKAQEDIMNKQNELTGIVHGHEDLLIEHNELLHEHNDTILEHEKKNKELDGFINKQLQKDENYDRLLKEKAEKDVNQDLEIEKNKKKNQSQDELIQEGIKKDEEQDALLEERIEKDKEHDKKLEQHALTEEKLEKKILELEEENVTLHKLIEKNNESISILNDTKANFKIAVISILIGGSALILSIVQFFV